MRTDNCNGMNPDVFDETLPLGKRLQQLNKYVKSVASTISSASDADNFLETYQKQQTFSKDDVWHWKTVLELANVLKRPGPIVNLLKEQNTHLIPRALSFRWLYTDETNSPFLNNDALIQLLPVISLSSRRKILNRIGKYSKNSSAVSQLYDVVNEEYGNHLAYLLIPRVEEQVVTSLVESRRIHFTQSQLLVLYQQHPAVAIKYLTLMYSDLVDGNNGHLSQSRLFFERTSCPQLLRHLAKLQPAEFLAFYEKFSKAIAVDFQCGPKLTRHLLEKHTSRILASPKLYARILHQKELIKRLPSSDLQSFLTSLFPPNLSNFQAAFEVGQESHAPLCTWFDQLPRSQRFPTLNSLFKERYGGKEITDFPDLITSRLILYMESEGEREKWVNVRLTATPPTQCQFQYRATGNIPMHNEGYWHAFLPTSKSIGKLKELLSVESDMHRRADLLTSLVLTCSVNRDKSALAAVCTYVSQRFRNDSAQVRLEFLTALTTFFDPLKEFEEDHWKGVNELLHISSLNNEFSHRTQLLVTILEKSIHFRLKRGLPADTQIQHLIKIKSRSYIRGESWCVAPSDPQIEAKALHLFAEHLSHIYPVATTPCPSDSAITSAIISLLESFAGWNRRQRRRRAKQATKNNCTTTKNGSQQLLSTSDYPWLMKRFQEILQSFHEPNKERLISALHHDPPAFKVLLDKLLSSAPLPPILRHHLQRKPAKLLELHDKLLDYWLRSNHIHRWSRIFTCFKSQGLGKLSEILISKCMDIADDDEESVKERRNALYILAHLMSGEKFVAWAAKFQLDSPDAAKLEIFDEEAENLFQLRSTLLKSLAKVSYPVDNVLSLLLKFCCGDYLKLCVGSLYSVVNRAILGQLLLEFLKELSARPVSVKKHAIRLMLAVSSKSANICYLKQLWETETHHSIRAILLNEIFRFFLANSSDEESWELLKSSVRSLEDRDASFFGELVQKEKLCSPLMPSDKLSSYFQVLMTKLKELPESVGGAELKWVKINLFQCITANNISALAEPILHDIFQSHLFLVDEEPGIQSAVVSVAVTYLLNFTPDPVEERTRKIINFLPRLLDSQKWQSISKDSLVIFPARQALSYFVEQLSIQSFKLKCLDNDDCGSSVAQFASIFKQLQERLRAAYPPCDYFVDDLFLSLGVIFQQAGFAPDDQALVQIGYNVGELVDSTVKGLSGEIVSIFAEIVKRFISLCFKYRLMSNQNGDCGGEMTDGSRLVLLIQGIMEDGQSVDRQILAANMLLSTNSLLARGHRYEAKYAELVKKLRDVENDTVKVFVNYRLTQCRSTRGYDILV